VKLGGYADVSTQCCRCIIAGNTVNKREILADSQMSAWVFRMKVRYLASFEVFSNHI